MERTSVVRKIGTGALHFNMDDPDPCDPFDEVDDCVEIPPLNLNSNTVTFTALDSAGDALNYWPVPSVANIAGDDIEPEYGRFVNLIDFAALVDDWLVYMPWP